MKRLTNVALIAICGILPFAKPEQALAGWELTFEDDFTRQELDRGKWRTSDYWGNQTLPGNAELQCYVPDAFTIDDSRLQIAARRETTLQDDCHAAETDLEFTFGMISTAGCNRYDDDEKCEGLQRFAQRYGYFEMRAKFPAGKGFWPEFWLLPDTGEWPPEIDVIEWIGDDSRTAFLTFNYEAQGAQAKKSGSFVGPDFSEGFHTFAVDWRPEQIIWYVDGVERFRVNDENLPDEPMYLLLNLAVGGTWPGSPDGSTRFPSVMEVDYVRVHEWTGDGSSEGLPQ